MRTGPGQTSSFSSLGLEVVCEPSCVVVLASTVSCHLLPQLNPISAAGAPVMRMPVQSGRKRQQELHVAANERWCVLIQTRLGARW
jgi:hypothetical protein